MNASIQRWQLLLRIALAVGALLWFERAGAPWTGLLVAALLFWFYGLVLGLIFAHLPRINRADRPSVGQLVRAWWNEFIICERIFAWQQPFREHRQPDFVPERSDKRGVLMLHGYTCNRGLWNDWMERLSERGHPHIALSMEPAFGSIDAYADGIEAAVARLTACSGGKPPVIVAHSMGGLAARAWWRKHGKAGRVHRIVTLGSPHGGTLMASFSPAFNARQMRRPSPWLAELAGAEPADFGAQFDCYYSHCDQIVCPADTAVLPGSRAIHLPGTGHLALVFHQRVWADLLQLLQHPPAQAPTKTP